MSVFATLSPLQMPHILELISSNLPSMDLRSCAKVCQLWRAEMNRALLKRRCLRFHFPNNEERFNKTFEKRGKKKYKMMIIDGRLPLDEMYISKILSMKDWGSALATMTICGYHSDWTAPVFYEMLKDFSPNLQRFTFMAWNGVDAAAVEDAEAEGSTDSLLSDIRRIDPTFQHPNLKCLRYEQGPHIQVELTDLCFIFPSLEHLHVTTRGSNRRLGLSELTSSKKLYGRSLKVLTYKTHELCCTPLLVLLHLKPKLEAFALKFATISKQTNQKRKISATLHNLLSQMHSSLERLAILKHASREEGGLKCFDKIEFDIDLPHLPNVSVFQLFPGKMHSYEMLRNSNKPVNENLPNVEEFCGSFADFHSSFKFNDLYVVCLIFPNQRILSQMEDYGCYPNVEFLTVHPKNIDDKLFHRLNDMFPNVKFLSIDTQSFKVSHDKSTIEPDFAEDRNPCLLTDTAITGIAQEDLNQLPGTKIRAGKIPKGFISAITTFPSLASFKNLFMATINRKCTSVTVKGTLYGPWEAILDRDPRTKKRYFVFYFTSRSGYQEFRESYRMA